MLSFLRLGFFKLISFVGLGRTFLTAIGLGTFIGWYDSLSFSGNGDKESAQHVLGLISVLLLVIVYLFSTRKRGLFK